LVKEVRVPALLVKHAGDAVAIQSDAEKKQTPVPAVSIWDGRKGTPLDDLSPSCLAARIEEERFRDGVPGVLGDRGHSFAEFFDTRLVRRGDDCYVDVLQMMFWSDTMPNASSKWDVDDKITKWNRFRDMLEAATADSAEAQPAAYSYGLSPRLRRGLTSQQSTQGSFGMSFSGYGADAQQTQQFSGRLYDPEIVGFTPHAAEFPEGQARAAAFGWIVGPERDGPGANRRRLAVEQAQLGAFVAVPSWWRTVLLRICTGFASESELPDVPQWWALINSPKRHEPGKNCRVHALRLPGTAAEFDRRLGMQVVRFPYIRTQAQRAPVPVLRAGEHGALLIEGGRLWRSTEVTVGAQRATSIRVLPNMEAIIAEFRCVDRPTTFKEEMPPKKQEPSAKDATADQLFRVPVQIWTSEGMAHQEYYARIAVPAGHKGSFCPQEGEPPPKIASGKPDGPPQQDTAAAQRAQPLQDATAAGGR